MKILVYGNRKQDDEYYDASTPEKREAAYLRVFQTLDEIWRCYDELKSYKTEKKKVCEPCTKDLCRLCEEDSCYCENSLECKNRNQKEAWEEEEILEQQKWYKEAKSGNGNSAIKLLQERSDNEYEEIRETEVIDPLEE